MANYPTSLDSFTNPTGVDSLSSPSHSLQHADANDAIEALEAKLGIGNSPAGSATAGRVLVASTGGSTSWTTVSAGAISTTGGTAGQYLSAGTAGVAQWADVTPAGLRLVQTETPSASSGVSFTGLTVGKRYRLMSTVTVSTNGNNMGMRFRENTTDKATSYYGAGTSVNTSSGTITSYTLNNNNRIWLTGASSTIGNPHIFDLLLFSATTGLFVGNWIDVANNQVYSAGGWNSSMSNLNGVSIYPETGTFTGTIKLYEYL